MIRFVLPPVSRLSAPLPGSSLSDTLDGYAGPEKYVCCAVTTKFDTKNPLRVDFGIQIQPFPGEGKVC